MNACIISRPNDNNIIHALILVTCDNNYKVRMHRVGYIIYLMSLKFAFKLLEIER